MVVNYMFDQRMLQQLLYVHQCLQEMQSTCFDFQTPGLQFEGPHGTHVPEISCTSYVNFKRELKQNIKMFGRKTIL
jgi:hypothetical protein